MRAGVEISLAVFTLKGEPMALAIAQDISERRKGEQEMINQRGHLEERGRDRRVRIQGPEQQQTEIERMAGTWGSGVRIAHEINNRLASIKGYFMFIQDAIPPDHPYHRNIGRIHGEINQIALILRELSEL